WRCDKSGKSGMPESRRSSFVLVKFGQDRETGQANAGAWTPQVSAVGGRSGSSLTAPRENCKSGGADRQQSKAAGLGNRIESDHIQCHLVEIADAQQLAGRRGGIHDADSQVVLPMARLPAVAVVVPRGKSAYVRRAVEREERRVAHRQVKDIAPLGNRIRGVAVEVQNREDAERIERADAGRGSVQ